MFGFIIALIVQLVVNCCCASTDDYSPYCGQDDVNVISHQLCNRHNGYARNRLQSTITLVTYADENTLDYFQHSGRILSLYSLHHGFDLWLFCSSHSPSTAHHEKDKRWEKVRVLRDVLALPSSSTDNLVIWIDADLIPLEFTFSFEIFLSSQFRYDVLVSSEVHGGTGVANTGCVILRPTEWSKQFIQAWWMIEHSVGHDQIGFDVLYKTMQAQEGRDYMERHIKVLPAHWLNSIPPAYLFQQPDHHFLHLMGERNDLRAKIFSMGLSNLCDEMAQVGEKRSLQIAVDRLKGAQLGLSIQVLRDQTVQLMKERLNILNAEVLSSQQEPLWKHVVLISEMREIILVLQRMGINCSSTSIITNAYDILQSITMEERDWLRDGVTSCRRCDGHRHRVVASQGNNIGERVDPSLIHALHMLALLGNDLIQSEDVQDGEEGLFNDISLYLQALTELVNPEMKPMIVENLAMLCETRARWLIKNEGRLGRRVSDEVVFWYHESIRLIEDIDATARNDFHLISPLMGLATVLCNQSPNPNDWQVGYQYWVKAVGTLQSLLAADKHFKTEHQQLIEAFRGQGECQRRIDPLSHDCCDRELNDLYLLRSKSNMAIPTFEKLSIKPDSIVNVSISHKRKFRKKKIVM